MVVKKWASGDVLYDYAIDNKLSFQNNVMIGKSGVIYLHVPILITGDTPKVRLYVFGKAAGTGVNAYTHGILVDHYHTLMAGAASYGTGWQTGNRAANVYVRNIGSGDVPSTISVGNVFRTGDSNPPTTVVDPIDYTNVPKYLKIYLDGVDKTSTIGDPNGKGGTMYSAGNGWGVDGTTVWDTGELDISATISWTVGDHYIELKETGAFGGTLVYTLLVN